MTCPYCSEGDACHVCGGTLYLPPGFVKNEESAPEPDAPASSENDQPKTTTKRKKSK